MTLQTQEQANAYWSDKEYKKWVVAFKAGTLSCMYRIQVGAQFGARVLELRSGRAPI